MTPHICHDRLHHSRHLAVLFVIQIFLLQVSNTRAPLLYLEGGCGLCAG